MSNITLLGPHQATYNSFSLEMVNSQMPVQSLSISQSTHYSIIPIQHFNLSKTDYLLYYDFVVNEVMIYKNCLI